MSAVDPASPPPVPADPVLGVAVGVLTAAALALRLLAVCGVPEQLDSIAFVHAMAHYSLAANAPHWPGYPIYCGAGKLATWLAGDVVRGLHAVSVLAASLLQIPLMLLSASWARWAGASPAQARRAAVATGLAWVLVLIASTTAVEIVSDPMAAAAAVTLLWLASTAYERGSPPRAVLALALAGLLPGIRLPAWTLAGPAVLCARWIRRERGPQALPLRHVAAAVLVPIVLWAGWQLGHEGSALFSSARTIVTGHMRDWGGGLATDPHPLRRPGLMLATFSTFGVGGWVPGAPWPRIAVTAVLGALVLAGAVRLSRSAPRAALLAAAWIGPYLVYHFVLHTVDLPRYQLALVALVCLLAGIGLPRRAPLGLAATGVLAATLALVTIPAARTHGRVPPVEYQFAAQCARLAPGAALLMIEDSHLLAVFTAEFAPRVAIVPSDPTAATAAAERLERTGHAAYATEPAPDHPGDWIPVARFCTDAIFDAESLTEVWLFRHQPGAGAVPLPACAPPSAGPNGP